MQKITIDKFILDNMVFLKDLNGGHLLKVVIKQKDLNTIKYEKQYGSFNFKGK